MFCKARFCIIEKIDCCKFSKSVFITKQVSIKLTVVTGNQVSKGQAYAGCEVDMLRLFEGIDYTDFNKPIAEIILDKKSGYFYWNNNYQPIPDEKLEALLLEVAKRKKQEEKDFKIAIKEANQGF